MPTPPRDEPARTPRARRFAWLALASALALAIAGTSYVRYASVWLREKPGLSRCVLAGAVRLAKPLPASGDAPRTTESGETVYLNDVDDAAVGCMAQFAPELAPKLTSAIMEPDADRRAAMLLALVKSVPPDEDHDDAAYAAFRLGYGALQALPRTDAVIATDYAMLEVYGCRFDVEDKCPYRPPMPRLVFVAGMPGALGGAISLGAGLVAGVRALARRVRARRARKAAEREAARAREAGGGGAGPDA
jgi:hypothetical protein